MEMSVDESKEFFVHFLSKDINLSSDQKELLLNLPILKHYTLERDLGFFVKLDLVCEKDIVQVGWNGYF